MSTEAISIETESLSEILGRAFNSAASLPPQAAERILQARFAPADLDRVDQLLEKKRDAKLTPAENDLLRDYLQADSVLTVLKSKARQSLKHG